MAGRGTDIKLGPGVTEVGGLYVIGTERHEARRIDRQLRGRCARQGDPGLSKFYISFEDDLMRNFGDSRRMSGLMTKFGMKDDEELQHPLLNRSVETAQKRVEQRNYQIRKHTLQYDDVMNQQREVIYAWRSDVLVTEKTREEIFDVVEETVTAEAQARLTGETAEPDSFITWVNATFPVGLKKDELDFGIDQKAVVKKTLDRIKAAYDLKVKFEEPAALQALERYIVLGAIDRVWQEHLYAMDNLRSSIHLRAIGQRDPLIEYKQEAYLMFEEMMGRINTEIVTGLFRSTSSIVAFEKFLSALPQQFITHANAHAAPHGMAGIPGLEGMPGIPQPQPQQDVTATAGEEPAAEAAPLPVRRVGPKLGRNDPCPLDPKKKFKNCCGKLGEHTCIKNIM